MIGIYLIERTIIDPSENEVSKAIYRVPYAYVLTRRKAERIRNKSKIFTKQDCWAISYKMREYTWTFLEYYKK